MKEIDKHQELKIDFLALGKNFTDFIATISHAVSLVRENIGHLLNLKIDSSKLAAILQSIAAGNDHITEMAQLFSLILIKTGYPPLPEFNLYASEIANIVNEYKKDSTSIQPKIDEFVSRKFADKEIKSLLEQWKSRAWLNKRIPILKEAIEAHLDGKYFIAISGLLPQIEGIIADAYDHNGKLKCGDYKQYVQRLLEKRDRWSQAEAAEEFFLQVVLKSFEHGKKIDSPLSRHAIVHGADVNYGTKANSLKTILLFDYLQNKFGVVSIGNRKTYHLLHCRVITYGATERHFFETREDAKAAGRKPCKICKP